MKGIKFIVIFKYLINRNLKVNICKGSYHLVNIRTNTYCAA